MFIQLALCKSFSCQCISDGARCSQGFTVDLTSIIQRFKRLVNDNGLELILPVLDLESDWDRKNELLLHGIVPKVLEPQCLVGVPLPEGITLDESIVAGVCRFFDLEVLPKCQELIDSIGVKQLNFE